jgi:hypothetical protein
MTDAEFDRALITAAFSIAAERGWRHLSVAEAARRAELPLARARVRFPVRGVVLLRFGSLADQAALADAPTEGPVRDRLFGMLMRRIDALQAQREGILALLRWLPTNPPAAALMAAANLRSMRWMLEGAGIEVSGPRGKLLARGLLAVWLATVRAWRSDTSEDLSGTMAALDRALRRAEQVAGWFCGRRAAEPAAPPAPPAPAEGGPGAPEDAAAEEDPSQPD